MTDKRIISSSELDSLEKADYDTVEGFRKAAWDAYLSPITEERNQVMDMLEEIAGSSNHVAELRMLETGCQLSRRTRGATSTPLHT
jgi:oligoendopeptidase F